jgi:hypothetical protein
MAMLLAVSTVISSALAAELADISNFRQVRTPIGKSGHPSLLAMRDMGVLTLVVNSGMVKFHNHPVGSQSPGREI